MTRSGKRKEKSIGYQNYNNNTNNSRFYENRFYNEQQHYNHNYNEHYNQDFNGSNSYNQNYDSRNQCRQNWNQTNDGTFTKFKDYKYKRRERREKQKNNKTKGKVERAKGGGRNNTMRQFVPDTPLDLNIRLKSLNEGGETRQSAGLNAAPPLMQENEENALPKSSAAAENLNPLNFDKNINNTGGNIAKQPEMAQQMEVTKTTQPDNTSIKVKEDQQENKLNNELLTNIKTESTLETCVNVNVKKEPRTASSSSSASDSSSEEEPEKSMSEKSIKAPKSTTSSKSATERRNSETVKGNKSATSSEEEEEESCKRITKEKSNLSKRQNITSQDDVVCMGKLQNEIILDDEEGDNIKKAAKKNKRLKKEAENFEQCMLCDKQGHSSFQCQMICKNCSAPYHGFRTCPQPANLNTMLLLFMEFCMQQLQHYQPNAQLMAEQFQHMLINPTPNTSMPKIETINYTPPQSCSSEKKKRKKTVAIGKQLKRRRNALVCSEAQEESDATEDGSNEDDDSSIANESGDSNSSSSEEEAMSVAASTSTSSKKHIKIAKLKKKTKSSKSSTKTIPPVAPLNCPSLLNGFPNFTTPNLTSTNPYNAFLLTQMFQNAFGSLNNK